MSGNLIQANSCFIPLKDKSVQLCAFSPPYWGLRSYKIEPVQFPDGWFGQLGLESSIDLFLDHMLLVMAEVWRVLRDDGVCFVNIGDTYSANRGYQVPDSMHINVGNKRGMKADEIGIKPKSLCLIPQKFAIRCQEAGWIVRSEIIWHKPNPMPESCKDRPTKAHEQVWMLTKQGKYFWDQEAIRERCADTIYTRERYKYACSPGKKHDLCQDTNICNTDFANFFTKRRQTQHPLSLDISNRTHS